MLTGCRVDDDCLIATSALYFANAVTESSEPSPGLGGAEVDEESGTFGGRQMSALISLYRLSFPDLPQFSDFESSFG